MKSCRSLIEGSLIVKELADEIAFWRDALNRLPRAWLVWASIVCLTVSTGVSATPITYYLSSTIASGSLGSITLSNTPVEFTVVSDSAGVTQVVVPGNSHLFFQNAATTSATITVHLPDGTTKTATFEPASQIIVAEDLANYGIAISSTVGGTTYPFGLVGISSQPSTAMDVTPAPIMGLPFVCANIDRALGRSSPCTPVSLTVRVGNSANLDTLRISKQFGSGCSFSTTCPARGFYAVVTNPTLFVVPATPEGGVISATGTTLDCPGTCAAAVTLGQDLVLIATPMPGYAFAGWAGACRGSAPTCALNISGVVTNVQAQFVPLPPTPLIATSISDSGANSAGPLCALTSTGSVQCWGIPVGGAEASTPVLLPGFTGTAVSVANGTSFTCHVTQSGATKCQGTNNYGVLGNGSFQFVRTDTPAPVSGLESGGISVAANYFTACALNASGGLRCWGYNAFGQLGNGTSTDAAAPVQVSGLNSGVIAVSVGHYHTCALVDGGGVRCWGYNGVGQLGNGTTTNSTLPVAVTGLSAPAVAIATGQDHTCALLSTGGVQCWGYNAYGQLGNPVVSPFYFSVPVAVSGLANGVIAIATGDAHTCALTRTGTVKCWGLNSAGQLGNGVSSSANGGNAVPADVVGIPGGVLALTAGGNETCAVTRAGAARCWGDNTFLQTGNWSAAVSVGMPGAVVGLGRNVVGLSAGLRHTCAVDTRGAAQCWGANARGGLGNGTTTSSSGAVAVTGLGTGVLMTTSGHEHSCALIAGGGIQCWGLNDRGQLGDGTNADSSLPRAVTGLAGPAVSVSAGANHSCTVTATGGVQCWGYNQSGQLGNRATTDSSTPVTVGLAGQAVSVAGGDAHTCVLSVGGAVQCWGADNFGQIGNGVITVGPVLAPTTVTGLGSGVVAIASGSSHTCALTGGGVRCWGANDFGQLGNGNTTASSVPVPVSGLGSGVIAISSTAYHSCALTYAGAVFCWGANDNGELGNGGLTNSSLPVPVTGLSVGVVALAAGGAHTCALMSSGTALCWGHNDQGQLGNGSTSSTTAPVAIQGLPRDNSLVMTNPAGLPAANASLIAGGATMTLAATASSGLPPKFSTLTPDRCAVSGSNLIALSPGLCAVQANQAGSASVDPAPTQNRIIVIGASAPPGQTITFGPAPLVSVGSTGTLSAGVSSGLPVTLGSLTPSVCTIDGFTVKGLARGQCRVAANQGGNAIYLAAQQVTQNFAITLLSQTISVDPARFLRVRGVESLSATASSGLPVTFSSTTPAICKVTSSMVTAVAAGLCGIQADQAGDLRFDPAPSQAVQISVFPALFDDFNGDGKTDLMWQNTNGAAAIWLMDGTAMQDGAVFGPIPGWSLFSGNPDFNADGKSDMVWTNPDGRVAVFLMAGTSMLDEAVIGPGNGWTLFSAQGDFNGDGKTDLVWKRADGAIAISLMDGTAMLGLTVYGPLPGWSLVSADNDVDGDGRNDLLWKSADGAAAIWQMNGTEVKGSTTFGPFAGWTVVSGDADYNGDGKTDLLWRHGDGSAAIWLLNGATVTGGTVFGPAPGWTVLSGRRDFNGDGMSDLLWSHSEGALAISLMNGAAMIGSTVLGPFAGWTFVPGAGDYDGDGKTDMLWTNSNGAAAILLMDGAAVRGSAVYGPFPGWVVVMPDSNPP
jgi:alpha-tubulin suppressor-like RCC1 family protein